jgi:iron(III) transport system ATP-binding protein
MGDASVLPGSRDGAGQVRVGPLLLQGHHPGPPGSVDVAVRPEAWRLVHVRLPGLPGRVARRHFLGRSMEYQVDTPLGPVLVHTPYAGLQLEPGAPVSLQLAADAAASVLARDASPAG